MKYTVYKTTNLLNDKIYIGIHGTKNINDSYIGSGRVFLKAVKKYGKSNFKKEILFVYENKKDALNKELELVDEDFIKKDTNYNCTVGGYGGIGKSNKGYKHTKEAVEKIIKAGRRKCKESTKKKISLANKGFKHSKKTIEKNRKARLEYYKNNDSSVGKSVVHLETGKKFSSLLKGCDYYELPYHTIYARIKYNRKKQIFKYI